MSARMAQTSATPSAVDMVPPCRVEFRSKRYALRGASPETPLSGRPMPTERSSFLLGLGKDVDRRPSEPRILANDARLTKPRERKPRSKRPPRPRTALRAQRGQYAIAHDLERTEAVDGAEARRRGIAGCPLRVILDQRTGLRPIDLEALAHGLFLVVVALNQVFARHIVLALQPGRLVADVVNAAGRGVDPPSADALDDLAVGHVDLYHVIERDPGVLQRIGLRDRAGETIEQIAVGAIGLLQPLLHQADDDVVGHQAAGVHDGLGGDAEGRARLHRRAQHLAGRNLRNAET